MTNVLFFPYSTFSPAENMAIDEYFLKKGDGLVIRLYGWNPKKTVTLGHFQKKEKVVNEKYCKEQNIAIVKRTTGGAAVYHKNDITYMISAPLSYFQDSSVTGSYKEIAEIFLNVFVKLGIPCQFAGTIKREVRKEGMEKGIACFLLPSDYEILADNKKIIGNAQKREGKRLVQHGSIAFDFDFSETAKVLNSDEEFLKRKVTCLKHYNETLTIEKFQEIFLQTLTDRKLKVNVEKDIYKYIDSDFLIELKGKFPLL